MEQEDTKEEIVSIKNFRPTPFQQAQWEVVDEVRYGKDFMPLELEVIPRAYVADPMFECFDEGIQGADVSTIKHGVEIGQLSEDLAEGGIAIDPVILEAQLQERFEAGVAIGRKQGEEDARLAVAEKYEELGTRVHSIWTSIDGQMKQFVAETEKRAVQLALAVARKILATTAEVRPEYIVDVIRMGVSRLGAATPLRVRISAQDMEFLEVVGLPPELSQQELGAEFVADDSVKSGCVIETDFGEIDLQLDSMWEQVSADLYGVYK